MDTSWIPEEARHAAAVIRRAEIVIGIPSYNNERTIGNVVRAACTGLAKYFSGFTSVVINSDGGSTDNTRDVALSARVEDSHLILISAPLAAAHRLSFPYQGIPGKGSAFRLIFEIARKLNAKACAVIDSDLRSITPEWIDLLIRPVLFAGFDFVAPYYQRHKFDGTITNSIVYPLTRMLYGVSVRQPIGGEFGMSGRLIGRYLEHQDWDSDVARFGIDIWMTTVAIAERYRVCQSFLGAKLHDAKDPGSDLPAMLEQVVGSVFALMQDYEAVWQESNGIRTADLFGFRFAVGVEPVRVNLERMAQTFRHACEELTEVWGMVLDGPTLAAVRAAGRVVANSGAVHVDDELWTRVVLQFACGYREYPHSRSTIIRALTPLYLGRVASFVQQTESIAAAQVEDQIEGLCQTFARLKPFLVRQWNSPREDRADESAESDVAGYGHSENVRREVST